MGEVFKHMGRPTCIVKSAYSRGEREEDLELPAALGVRFWLSGLSSAQCAAARHKSQRGVNGQRGGARLESLKHALKKDMSQVRMAFSVERARPAFLRHSAAGRAGRFRDCGLALSRARRSFFVHSETGVLGSTK